MELIDIIIKYGLSIRQIPLQVVSEIEIRHYQEGDEIIQYPTKGFKNYEDFKATHQNIHYHFDDGTQTVTRDMCRRTRIPKNAGYWLCKQVPHMSTRIDWNINDDNLALTLEESINLFLSRLTTP